MIAQEDSQRSCVRFSFEAELVDKVQAHLLRVFRPLARLPAESEVGLDALVAGLEDKLRTNKVGVLALPLHTLNLSHRVRGNSGATCRK